MVEHRNELLACAERSRYWRRVDARTSSECSRLEITRSVTSSRAWLIANFLTGFRQA
jgi:hypothetical protein